MKLLVMLSTLLVTLTTVGLFGESSQCIEARTQVKLQASMQVLPQDTVYLMAACEAEVGHNDLAFSYLNELKQRGFNDADWLLADVRLESLHQDGRWQVLVDEISSVQQQALAKMYSESIEKASVKGN